MYIIPFFLKRDDLSLNSDICESLFIEIYSPGRKNINVGVLYRPPTVHPVDFIESFDDFLHLINQENKLTFFMGDFNIDLLQYESHQATQDFVNSLFSNYQLPLINKPTHITETSATLIDNIISNNTDCNISSGILFADITDHLPVFQISTFSTHKTPLRSEQYVRREINACNIASFSNELSKVNWNYVLSNEDPNGAFDMFHLMFSKLYDKCFPVKQVKANVVRKKKCWMTAGLIKSVKYKHRLYTKMLNHPSASNKSLSFIAINLIF